MLDVSTMSETEDSAALAQVRDLLVGYQISQTLYVAARLGIADLLASEPASVQEIAEATGAHPEPLTFLLAVLVGAGLLRYGDDGRYSLTPAGRTMQADRPDSLRPTILATGKERYQSWGRLLETVRTGRVAFADLHGMGLHDFYAAHPGAAEPFNDAMAALTAQTCERLTAAYDFAVHDIVVDVGGGVGVFMEAILNVHPDLRGVVFDLPHVVAEARKRVGQGQHARRLIRATGDARKHVPSGGDLYVLKTVLCDFPDDEAAAILRACREAMRADGRLVIFDKLRSDEPTGSLHSTRTVMSALNLLVMTGGRERSRGEFAHLLESAGFGLDNVWQTEALNGEIHRLVAVPTHGGDRLPSGG